MPYGVFKETPPAEAIGMHYREVDDNAAVRLIWELERGYARVNDWLDRLGVPLP